MHQQAAEAVARSAALQSELKALTAQVAELRLSLQRQAAQAQVASGRSPATNGKSHPRARTVPKRPRRKRSKLAAEPPPPPSQAEEVRALMASVAAQLQSVSEANGGGVPRDRQRRARESLVQADRAAALSLWERARELALVARDTLDGKSPGQGAKTPGELEALMRDAEQLFPGRVRADGHGLAVSLPVRRGHSGEVPVDRGSLSHIGRLARVYDRMRLTVQFHEPTRDLERAQSAYAAVRQLLMDRARVSEDRIQAANPLTKVTAVRESAGHLVIGFSAP